jgi:hypothetical protein
MKRITMAVFAALLLLGVASVGATGRSAQLADEAMALEQAWAAWLLGGSSNALLAEDFCGEVVDGRFFLTISAATGATELDCEIPAGTEVVASPFGALTWAPTDGENGTQLFNAVFDYLDGVVPRSVKLVLDGTTLPKEPMLCAHPFDIALEPGNSLQQLDPAVEGEIKGNDLSELRFNVTVP